MMRLPPFTYLAPKTVADAARLLGEHGADAMIVAGGTDLYPNMKRRQFEPKVLVGLGAHIRLTSADGERTVPIATLYRDDGIDYLAKRHDEILADIVLPPADGWRSRYLKLRRRGSFDFPVLGVAVNLRMDADVVSEARIVLGAVASLPREAKPAAESLRGQRLTEEAITRAADLAAGPAKPLDNTDYAHFYRKKMTRVFVARALRSLAGLDDGVDSTEAP